MSKEPTTSFDFVRAWFKNCATQAKKQGKQDSAALWQDGLAHLEHQQKTLLEVKSGLSLAYDALEKGFYDEAMLHVGHHLAKVSKVVG